MIAPITRLWTVEEYHQMADAGILSFDERVELIDGVIISMAAQKPPHAAITKITSDYLRNLLAGLADIRTQAPIHLGESSEPEPDIAVVRIDFRNYIDHHPTPEDIFLIVEVADTTLNYDRNKKAALYSKAGIIEYWVIDVVNELVYVFRLPEGSPYGYGTVNLWDRDDVQSLVAFPDIAISIDQFFPSSSK